MYILKLNENKFYIIIVFMRRCRFDEYGRNCENKCSLICKDNYCRNEDGKCLRCFFGV